MTPEKLDELERLFKVALADSGYARMCSFAVVSFPSLISSAREAGRLREALNSAPIMSKYHGIGGFATDRFIADYEAWRVDARAALSTETGDQS